MHKALSVLVGLVLLSTVGIARQRGAEGAAPGEAQAGDSDGTWTVSRK